MIRITGELFLRTMIVLLAGSVTACGPAGGAESGRVEESAASAPPGYTTGRTGGVHDFGFLCRCMDDAPAPLEGARSWQLRLGGVSRHPTHVPIPRRHGYRR